MAHKPYTPNIKRFEFNAGLTSAMWRGVVKEGSAASIPDNSFRDAKNVRFYRSGLIPRGGQAKLTANALGGTLVTGIFQFDEEDSGGGERIFYAR